MTSAFMKLAVTLAIVLSGAVAGAHNGKARITIFNLETGQVVDSFHGPDQLIREGSRTTFSFRDTYLVREVSVFAEARGNQYGTMEVTTDGLVLQRPEVKPRDPRYPVGQVEPGPMNHVAVEAISRDIIVSKVEVYVVDPVVDPITVEPVEVSVCDGLENPYARFSCEIYWSAGDLRSAAFELYNEDLEMAAEEIQTAASRVYIPARAREWRDGERLNFLSKKLVCTLHDKREFLLNNFSIPSYRQPIESILGRMENLQEAIGSRFDAYVIENCQALANL